MKRRRRKRYKRRQKLYWKLPGAMLIGAVCIALLVWRHPLIRTGMQDSGEEGRLTDMENEGAQGQTKEPSEPQKPEQEQEPFISQEQEQEREAESSNPEPAKEELLEQEIEELLERMTLEERICQMFIVTPEQLTGVSPVTQAGEATKEKLKEYPVGGLIYFASNLISKDQTKEMLADTMGYAKEAAGFPIFLCVDEEGGRVARVGSNPAFHVERIRPMGQITDEREAYQAGAAIGGYLHKLGFNVDFAPDADVITNEKNTVIGDRSFGRDPETVTRLAAAVSDGLHSEGILSTFKHFPGHGATQDDTHQGYAYAERTYEELLSLELVPFAAANENGVDMVMAAHISLPDVLGDDTPCSLSYQAITKILREDLGYEGLVVTDALNMGAIAENYSADEAAIKAVEAGVDLLLMPKDFPLAYEGLKSAVSDGRLSEERINESVRRILRKKFETLAK